MHPRLSRVGLAMTVAALAIPLRAEVYSHLTPVPAEDAARIEAAAPPRPSRTPRQARKLLVYAYAESFHSSVPHGARALEVMGRKSGAYEAFLTSDTNVFEPESLARFDGIFLLNITPVGKLPKELFLPNCGEGFEKLPPAEQARASERNERLKKSIMDFVRGGKGICGNHSTTDCFYQWRDFGRMIGGYFDGHPWHQKVTLELVDPTSPVNQAFGGKSPEVVDEIYQFKDTYSRDELHVLTRLDPLKVDVRGPGVNRRDGDIAVSWIRDWGKGRVFYCSLGHREDVYTNPMVLQHFLDGIQFALGDLDADTRPTATLAPGALEPLEAAPGVFVQPFSDRFRSANAGWLVFDDHVKLIGTPHSDAVSYLLANVRRATGKPVREVILTHLRGDELQATLKLAAAGVAVTAGPGAASRLAAAGLPAGTAVDEVTQPRSLTFGAQTIDLIPVGPAATASDLAVFVHRGRVLFTGDLCVNGPRTQLAGSSTAAWIRALDGLRRLEPEQVVPGRGAGGGPGLLLRQQRFLRELRRQVGHSVAQGLPFDEVRQSVRLEPEWLVWMPYDTPVEEDIAHIYTELTVPRSPFLSDPFDLSAAPPRALAVIGDSPHEPGHLQDGLEPVFAKSGVATRFAVDPRALTAENLKAVELLVILRDGYVWPEGRAKPASGWMTPEQERAVVDFVERGGAFLALHNSTGLYPKDGPYLGLLGGTYDGHGPLERFRVRPVAKHPITLGVNEFEVADEQHTPRPDLGKVQILLESVAADGTRAAAGWVRQVGKGRVAYLANGHTRDALEQPMYRRLLGNAIAWCLQREDPRSP